MEFALLGQQLVYYTKSASTYLLPKLGFGLILLALAPHALALQGLAMLVAIDFICGVWAAKRSRTLSSLGMRRGIAKMLIYFIFINAVALAERSVLNTNVCTMTAIGILSATEVLSIVENLVILGLPIPYAAKILSLVGNKAAMYGIKLDLDDPSLMASAKDVLTLIDTVIPEIEDPLVQTCLETFASQWYQFMRSLEPTMFTGSHDLMWERLKHAMDRTLVDIHSELTKNSVPVAAQTMFLEGWAGELLKAFRTTAQVTATADLEPMKRIASVQDALSLMLFRLVQVAKDRKVLAPAP